MRISLMQRLTAILALLAYAALVYLFLRTAVNNPGFIAFVGLTMFFLIYTTWLIFSGDEKARRRGYLFSGIASLAVLFELIYFLAKVSSLKSTLLFIILALFYVVITRILRERYWKAKRSYVESKFKTADFKHPFLIINPKSGNGRAMKAGIERLAQKQGINVLTLHPGDNAADAAEQAVRDGADVLGISGGDGSIGAVAQVALKHDLPIVVLPGGTKCHFARDIGLDPDRIVDSLNAFHGIERRIDIGDINGRIFLNNASFGLYADIVNHPEYRNHKVQVTREVLQSIVSGSKKLYDLRYRHNNEKVDESLQVLVGVNCYDTVNILEVGKRDKLDEGILQVTAIKSLDESLAPQLMRTVMRRKPTGQDNSSGIEQWEVKKFTVGSGEESLAVGVDGESETYATPVTIQLLPKALRVYVPAEGIRSRPKNPFNFVFVRQLWNAVSGHATT